MGEDRLVASSSGSRADAGVAGGGALDALE